MSVARIGTVEKPAVDRYFHETGKDSRRRVVVDV
jgi:hypothetical protein